MMSKSDDKIFIASDAAFNDVTHKAGLAAILLSSDGLPVYILGKDVQAEDNTKAELLAILFALDEIPNEEQEVVVQTDSLNAYNTLQESAKLNVPWLIEVAKQIKAKVAEKKLSVTYKWVPREENESADAVSKLAVRHGDIWARR